MYAADRRAEGDEWECERKKNKKETENRQEDRKWRKVIRKREESKRLLQKRLRSTR